MLNKAINKAADWLFYSGIQNGREKMGCGGFNSWFDADNSSYKYIYSEITGYGATILSFLHKNFGGAAYLEKARLAGEWLIKYALHPSGGVLTRYYFFEDAEKDKYSFESETVYSFDTGVALFGLCSLHNLTKEKQFLAAAAIMGNFLIDKCRRDDGLLFAYYDGKIGKPGSDFSKWSTQSGSFHAKAAMGLIALYKILGDKKYKEAAESLCDAALKFQKENGRFVSFADQDSTHLHPHMYSCEGLLYAGLKLKEPKYILAAARGVIWALDNAVRYGGRVNYLFFGGRFNDAERTDALSQLLRLALYFLQTCSFDSSHKEKVNVLARRLLACQCFLPDKEKNGGFYYGETDDGEKLNHLNSWCTMFALQTLCFYKDFLRNKHIALDYLC